MAQSQRDVNLREMVLALTSPEHEELLSPDLIELIQRGLHTHDPDFPDTLKPRAAEAFQTTFELMGGLPRMLLWADRNPGKFYQLFARQTLPTIAPVLPTTQAQKPQDWPEWLTARRLAYDESAQRQQPREDAKDDAPE